MVAKNPFQNSFSIKDIGTGRFFTKGSMTHRTKMGLAGALRKSKTKGFRSFAKNLSKGDMVKFQGLIGDEAKKLSTHSEGLPRLARRRIMMKAEKMRRAGEISVADKQDLKNILEALKPQKQRANTSSEAPQTLSGRKAKRAVNFVTDDKNQDRSLPSAKSRGHIQTGIKEDIAREARASEDQGDPLKKYHHPASTLGSDSEKEKEDTIAKREGLKRTKNNKNEMVEIDIG